MGKDIQRLQRIAERFSKIGSQPEPKPESLNEVLTNDVKDGWSFIVFSHSPLDYEYQFGMAKRFRNTNPEDVISSQNLAKGNLIAINDLFNAINGKKHSQPKNCCNPAVLSITKTEF